MYEVVYPLGRLTQQVKRLTSRLNTLDGITICELSNHKFSSELTFAVVEESLLKRYPDMKFISYEEFGNTYGRQESEVIKALPEKLKKYGCDAVISGNGG